MRVLLVTDWPGEGGGVETYVMLVARGLREAGDEVRLLTSSVGGGAAVADYVAFGARSPVQQSVLQIANPAAARTVRRAVAELEPDVAHVSMFEMHLSPSVLSALRGVPTVLSVAYYKPICPNGLKLLPDDSLCAVQPGAVCWRGGCVSLAHWLRDRPRYARIRSGLRTAGAVVTCSQWLQRELAAAGVESASTAWPIERPSPSFRRRPAPEPLFVYLGRLAREKGVETLLRALARVQAEVPGVRLRVVGEGPQRPALERLAADLGLRDAVEFTGWLPLERIEEQLADAWALVAPSLWAEPFGLTAVEAVSRGVPAIVSLTGGLAETVDAGVTGLLFPNGDAEALAACLVEVATGRSFADGLPAAEVERVQEKHDLGRHVTWLRALFAEVSARGVGSTEPPKSEVPASPAPERK
jgi:glycosyltransferase involved in cell wall biosynthesis